MDKYTLSEVTSDSFRNRAALIHAVDENGAICGKVKADNLCGWADPKYTAPTCPHCLKKWK